MEMELIQTFPNDRFPGSETQAWNTLQLSLLLSAWLKDSGSPSVETSDGQTHLRGMRAWFLGKAMSESLREEEGALLSLRKSISVIPPALHNSVLVDNPKHLYSNQTGRLTSVRLRNYVSVHSLNRHKARS